MPQKLTSGQDVTALMSGADVTDLMNAPAPSLQIAPGTKPADAIAQMKAFNANQAPAEDTGGSLGKFVGGVAEQLNPIEMVKGLFGAVTSPWQTAKNLTAAQVDQFSKGKAMYDAGRYSEAAGHAMAGLLPLLGPAAAGVGENIGAGNIAEGLGQTVGLVGTVGAPTALKAGAKTASTALQAGGIGERLGTIAERIGAEKFVKATAPQVGANKIRFGNMAADAAPEVLREPGMGAMSRSGLADKVAAKLEEATTNLDTAADARNAGRAYATKPIIEDLKAKRRALTAEAVEGSEPTRTVSERMSALVDPQGKPITVTEQTRHAIGKDVVPEHNKTRVAQIDKAIDELETLGPMARYESLRRIRQSYDQPAKVKYAPAMTPDFLAKRGEASGAADVTSVLRDSLAKADPATAAANKPYALWKKMDDVLTATEEVERVRPAVGRKIIARLGGMVAGGEAGGAVGAVLGGILAPMVDSAMIGSPTTSIMTARALTQLADALKRGNVELAASTVRRLRALSVIGQTKPKTEDEN